MSEEIPVVDLADKESDAAAAALRKGFGDFGLVYVRNHGVDIDRLHRFYDLLIALFAKPESEKQAWARPDIWYQRGWTPPNTEQAVVAGGQPDFKECYFAAPIPLDPKLGLMFPEIYSKNSWPDGTDEGGEFGAEYLALGTQVHEVGLRLLEACALALDLPKAIFAKGTEGGPHVTRALRYLALSEEQVGGDIVWGEEHTDFNLVTLLPGGRFFDPSGEPCGRPDPDAGLYLRTRPTAEHPKGRMVHGRPPPGCIVAQVGQQLEILTGGTFLATPHVITAPKKPGYTRTAFAHFVHLHSEERLFPLEKFLSDDIMRAYGPPRLAGTYGLKTLVDIGLAPKSALEKLGYRHYDRLAQARSDG